MSPVTTVPTGERLTGPHLDLSPVTEADLPGLARILAQPTVYSAGYVMHHRPETEADALAMARSRYLDPPAFDGHCTGRVAYAVRLLAGTGLGEEGTVVGTSSLGDADLANERLHLGWTMYDPAVWGTFVNPETKFLLLRHAIEELGFGRVKIQTDALNTRSQAAIAKLGAQREGVLRRHARREDGSFRDSVLFSVTVDDWPRVREGLLARIGG